MSTGHESPYVVIELKFGHEKYLITPKEIVHQLDRPLYFRCDEQGFSVKVSFLFVRQ